MSSKKNVKPTKTENSLAAKFKLLQQLKNKPAQKANSAEDSAAKLAKAAEIWKKKKAEKEALNPTPTQEESSNNHLDENQNPKKRKLNNISVKDDDDDDNNNNFENLTTTTTTTTNSTTNQTGQKKELEIVEYKPEIKPLHKEMTKIEDLVPEEDLDDEARYVPNSIFISGLPKEILVDEIARCFQHLGTIEKINFVPDRRFAFIKFMEKEAVQRAIDTMHSKPLHGNTVRVVRARSRAARFREQIRKLGGNVDVDNPDVDLEKKLIENRHRWVDLDDTDDNIDQPIYDVQLGVLSAGVNSTQHTSFVPQQAQSSHSNQPMQHAPPQNTTMPNNPQGIDYGFDDLDDE